MMWVLILRALFFFSVRIFIVGEFGPAIIPEIWHGPHI